MSKEQLQTLTLIRRKALAQQLGLSFEGKRDLYEALGYPSRVQYSDCYAQFRRQDMAQAIINRPVKATWTGPLTLLESDDDNETPLEKAWKELEKTLKLKDKFSRLDRLTSLGRYGVLLLGLDDVRNKDDLKNPVTGRTSKLKYVKPLGEDSARIIKWERRSDSARFGLPVLYELTLGQSSDDDAQATLVVHHTRVIHVVGERMESEVYGLPVLEVVFNRLKDLEKLVGGSAEMFWKGARPGYGAKLDENYTLTADTEEDLKKQIDEYEHNLRRFITLEGFDLKALEAQVSDPSNHVDIQIQMISAVTGIPKRILVGSERGELASSQDVGAWKEKIQTRREEHSESNIIRPFVDRCMELGVLPETKDEYFIQWSDLFAVSDKDKAEVGRTRAAALKEYVSQPGAEFIVPPQVFLEFFLGMTAEQVELINEMRDQAIKEEEQDFEPDDITDEEAEA